MSRKPTIEWQVCGVCNYDCSYCIQSKKSRVGHPSPEQIEGFLSFFAGLQQRFELKMSGGEPFSFRGFMEHIVPGLITRTPHTLSVLTNLSAPLAVLERFATVTRGRLGIVSASLHLEFAQMEAFVEKARCFREMLEPEVRLIVNSVVVPGGLGASQRARDLVHQNGLPFFPQLLKTKRGVHVYDDVDRLGVEALLGPDPTSSRANVAPSYRGRLCFAGVDYFVVTQAGDAWTCRSARRVGEGFLGNVLDGSFTRATEAQRCKYDICPCTVPANRSMIEGV